MKNEPSVDDYLFQPSFDPVSKKQLEEYIMAKPGVFLDYPFGKEVAVYKVGDRQSESDDATKMFALIAEDSNPARISLKCDPQLAKDLRAQYESVMEGYHLSKKHWNTILCSGQLSEDDIQGFIDHSYQLVTEGLPKGIRENLEAK